MNVALDKKISFGDITVDPQSNLITVAGKEKRLEPKLVALLMYLARHSQQVITRQQITETIWPDVVVGEESITQAIFSLRNALGDDAKRPKYIETIPKKGYRFLVDIVDAEQQQEALATKTPRRYWGALSILAILIAIGLIAWLAPRSDYEIGSVLPVTKMPGAECCMAIRGNKMAFINIVNASSNDIYLKDLTTGIQKRITEDAWRKHPLSWLDDNTLIYPRCSDIECQIVRHSIDQVPQVLYNTSNYITQLTLSPDNSNILIFNQQNTTSHFIIYDLRTSKKRDLHQEYPELPPYIHSPVLSMSADTLYFLNISPSPIIMSLDLTTAKLTTVTDGFDEITGYTLDRNDQLFITGTHKATQGLWVLTEHSKAPVLILRPSGDEKFLLPAVTPAERAIYYQSTQYDQDLGSVSTQSKILENFSDINSTGIDQWATPSPDNRFIYFLSNRTGFSEVWWHDLTSKVTKPITNLKADRMLLVLPANNGQRFAASYIDDGQATLGIFSAHTGELLVSQPIEAYPLSWSMDDSSIYAKKYTNNFPILMRYDSQTLASVEIQQNAGLYAQESVDRTSLTFVDYEKNALVKRTFSTAKTEVLASADFKLTELWTGRLRVDSTENAMLLVKQGASTPELWRYPFDTAQAEPQKLMDLPAGVQVTHISNDGTYLLYDKAMPANGSIMKIELK